MSHHLAPILSGILSHGMSATAGPRGCRVGQPVWPSQVSELDRAQVSP